MSDTDMAAQGPLDRGVRRRGRVCQKLAALLQKSFPKKGTLALTWSADWLYPATGAWRTNTMLDCWRWEGYARHYREDGSYMTVMEVGSYTTMTELIKADRLCISPDGSVWAE